MNNGDEGDIAEESVADNNPTKGGNNADNKKSIDNNKEGADWSTW